MRRDYTGKVAKGSTSSEKMKSWEKDSQMVTPKLPPKAKVSTQPGNAMKKSPSGKSKK